MLARQSGQSAWRFEYFPPLVPFVMVFPLRQSRGGAQGNQRRLVFLNYWLPVVVWAAVIFWFSTDTFSSENTEESFGPVLTVISYVTGTSFETTHFVVRKCAHLTEYFVFALLLIRAIKWRFGNKRRLRCASCAVLAVFLYACSDEFHQSFVPSRGPSFADVGIDSLGGICGVLWSYVWRKGKRLPPEVTMARQPETKKT
jgi:VanZ family protein